MIEHLAVAIVSAIAFLGAISSVRCVFAAPVGGMEVLALLCSVLCFDGRQRFFGKRAFFRLWGRRRRCGASDAV